MPQSSHQPESFSEFHSEVDSLRSIATAFSGEYSKAVEILIEWIQIRYECEIRNGSGNKTKKLKSEIGKGSGNKTKQVKEQTRAVFRRIIEGLKHPEWREFILLYSRLNPAVQYLICFHFLFSSEDKYQHPNGLTEESAMLQSEFVLAQYYLGQIQRIQTQMNTVKNLILAIQELKYELNKSNITLH